MKFTADIQDNKLVKLSTINLVATDLNLDAKADFNEQTGRVKNILVNYLSVGDSEISGTIKLRDSGRYHAKLKGKRVNLNRFISETNPHHDSEKIKFSVDADFDKVFLWDLPPIKNVNLKIEDNAITIPKMKLSGLVDGCPVHIDFFDQNRVREFKFRSNKAGCVLTGLDITGSIDGGEIVIDGKILSSNGQEITSADISITDFGLKDAPLFYEVLNVTSLSGLSPIGLINTLQGKSGLINALQGKGIKFDQLDATTIFTKNKIEIMKLDAHGPFLGVSATGTIMRDNKETNIKAVIVPAYELNSYLKQLPPIIAEILTGTEKKGFFAAEYYITGSLDKPKIDINQLEALSPGILRTFLKATRPKSPQ